MTPNGYYHHRPRIPVISNPNQVN
uniref:Uncharacterized protein n=1 Tax=Arundo donax TaxID=35708 RepID=A0A0A9CB46_ARUDO